MEKTIPRDKKNGKRARIEQRFCRKCCEKDSKQKQKIRHIVKTVLIYFFFVCCALIRYITMCANNIHAYK